MVLSTSVQREDNSRRQCPRVNDYYSIGTKSEQNFLMLSLQALHRDQGGCDATACQQLKMGTQYFATPCDVCACMF